MINKTKAYIISNNGKELIASVETNLNSGEVVFFSENRIKECINANREWNLVNVGRGKISRAQKWRKTWVQTLDSLVGIEINKGEFYLV